MPLTVDQLEQKIVAAMHAGDWDTVTELGAQMDEMEPPKASPGMVNSALWYASVGLRVFPLQPGGRHLPLAPGDQDPSKIPHTRDDGCIPSHPGTRGCLDATTNPERIIGWWRRWPNSNVGIATGHLVDVIDIDGPVGVKSWAHIQHLPPILGTVSTPRAGGTHLYVAAAGDGNAARVWPGIDLRGRGGYVVAPPSINNDGIVYRWRQPLQLPAIEVAA